MRPFPHNLKILFYADLHVGDRSNGRKYTDMLEAEGWITDLAVERKVDWVIFGGDAFKLRNPHDEHKTAWLRHRAARSVVLAQAGISEFDLVGNHCRWYKAEESGHVFEAVNLLSRDASHLRGVADKAATVLTADPRVIFHCLPAQTEYYEGVWSPDPQAINLCLFHGMVKGCSLNQEGTVKADHGVPTEVLDRPEFDFVFMGDIHLPQMIDFKNTRGGYVGSTLQLDSTDIGERRGILIVTFSKGHTEPEVEFVPVPQAELKTMQWDASQPLPDLSEYAGHLVTMKIKNPTAISSIDLAEAVDKVRSVVRHLSTTVESSDPGKATLGGETAIYATPADDFDAYMQKLSSLDDSRRARLSKIMKEEVLNVVPV